jgi:anthranilate synthase component 1
LILPSREEFHSLTRDGNLIPVYAELPADLDTPLSAFLRLRAGPYAFLLESVEGGEKWARYSFLGTDPFMVFTAKGNRITIKSAGKPIELIRSENPLDALRTIMARFRPVDLPHLPRFVGGAVGYLSYDMARFFERLPRIAQDDLRLPDALFLLTDTLVAFDNLRHRLLVITNAHVEERTPPDVDRAYDQAVAKITATLAKLARPAPLPPPLVLPQLEPLLAQGEEGIISSLDQAAFMERVRRAKELIAKGDAFQIVLSRRLETPLTADPFRIYRALRTINPSPYLFYLKLGRHHLVGSSPEVLVRAEDGQIEVRPIAGTRPRGRSDAEDRAIEQELLADPKERAEHVMLVDLGRNDVGRVAKIGSVTVTERMAVERYSHVMHLVSNIRGQMRDDVDAFEVLRACFPAGTLTGAPKIRAMEIIEELEPTRRGPYGGAVGYVSYSGNLDSCITIRSVIISGKRAFVQAGAGIVADSDPKAEWLETVNKAKGLILALRLANL